MNVWLVMDSTYEDFNYSCFKESEWASFYPDTNEEKEPDDPISLGKSFRMTCFVDAVDGKNEVT